MPDNPAVHIERSGNDIVKRASELNVEEKASDSASSKKRERKKEEGDGTITENAEGKDVKKQKMEKNTAPGHEEQRKKEEEEEEKKDEEGAPKKKAPGRPNGTGFRGAKARKEPKPRSTEGVSSRTRSGTWCLAWVWQPSRQRGSNQRSKLCSNIWIGNMHTKGK
jgi:hypothetical protein